MLALWFIICACGNAWVADHSFKKGDRVFALVAALVAVACLALWWGEMAQ